MKVSPKLLPVMLAVQALVLVLMPMLTVFSQPVYAAAPAFQDVFYYPSDADTPNAEEDMVDSFLNMENGSGGLKQVMNSTYVDIEGGPFGANPQELELDSGDTSPSNYVAYQLNNGDGYDCYVDSTGTAQLSIPNNQPYWHIDFDMYVHQNGTAAAPNFTVRERIASATEIQGPNPAAAAAGGAGAAYPLVGPVKDHSANGLGHPELDPPASAGGNDVGLPSQCLPDPAYFSHHLSFSPLQSYYQNPTAWPSITANPAGVGSAGGGGTEDTCDAGAVSLGWLLCPIIDLATSTIQAVVNDVIIPELQVQPLVANSSDSQYQVWSNIRTLADVLFVIVFLVIIFANTLQFNLNAYAIKKVIPRLVAAAILVQFSFILSAVLIDMGNILGQGIASLVNVTIPGGGATGGSGSTFASLGGALDIGITAALIAIIGIPTILIVVVTGLISVLGVLFTLIARRLILVVLVILSPLAFAAWVVPGTERYFNMWLKGFIRTVLMYPMIIFLLSAASIGSAAVSSGGSQIEGLLAAIFPIVAFFMIPMTFKWAGSAMGMAAGGFNKLSNKANSSGAMQGLRKGARESQQRVNQDRAAGYKSATVFGRTIPGSRRVMTGLGRVGTGQVMPTNRTKSNIALQAQKAMAEESKRVEALNLDSSVLGALVSGDTGKLNPAQKASYDQNKSLAKTYTGRAAIANQLAKKSNVEGLDKFREKLNTDVGKKRITETQATQLWNGAKAGAFSDIKARDPIMAASGWADSEYTGAALQTSMSRVGGEDIAKTAPSRLQAYAGAGATLSASQIQSATSDKSREGKSVGHQGAMQQLVDQSIAAGGTSGAEAQLESYIRFEQHPVDPTTGLPAVGPSIQTARGDAAVREIRRKYATDATYRQDVADAITAHTDIPAP